MPKLYIVPTPVGNLEDITLRAIRILREADFILAEDTRTSGNLLRHLNIHTRIQPYHKYNEHKILTALTEQIRSVNSVALVSDAGTPGISDPGYLLIRQCIEEKIMVECLPGPTAFVPALIESGLPCNRFLFEGFLPVKKGRKTRLSELVNTHETIVFFESPFRITKTLEELSQIFGLNRKASVSREISKLFHETRRGTLDELVAWSKSKSMKGEFVIILERTKDGV